MTPPKEHNKFSVTKTKEIKIYKNSCQRIQNSLLAW